MSAVPVQIDGVLWHVAEKRPEKVTLIGSASIVGLTVGGGPIVPPDAVPPDPPPVIGGGPIIPDPPDLPDVPDPVPPSSVIKAPPATGGWGLYSDAASGLYWAYAPQGLAGGPKGGGM